MVHLHLYEAPLRAVLALWDMLEVIWLKPRYFSRWRWFIIKNTFKAESLQSFAIALLINDFVDICTIWMLLNFGLYHKPFVATKHVEPNYLLWIQYKLNIFKTNKNHSRFTAWAPNWQDPWNMTVNLLRARAETSRRWPLLFYIGSFTDGGSTPVCFFFFFCICEYVPVRWNTNHCWETHKTRRFVFYVDGKPRKKRIYRPKNTFHCFAGLCVLSLLLQRRSLSNPRYVWFINDGASQRTDDFLYNCVPECQMVHRMWFIICRVAESRSAREFVIELTVRENQK